MYGNQDDMVWWQRTNSDQLNSGGQKGPIGDFAGNVEGPKCLYSYTV